MGSFKYLREKYSSLPTLKKLLVSFFVLVLLGVSAFAGYSYALKNQSAASAVSPEGNVVRGTPEEAVDTPNPITGVLFKKSDTLPWINQLPLGIIIENSTDARPQMGLNNADVVYEALAEGGITRFLAIYLQENASVGPVRSNRPYYIDWLSEYDAAYAHVGGSPEGQARIKAYGIKDLDQFGVGAPTYERVTFRAAPHNVYTSTEKLRAVAANRGYQKTMAIVPWKFADKEPLLAERPAAFALNISFLGNAGYRVLWTYKPETNTYLRSNGGAAHMDALTNTQLEFKTIVLQVVNKSFDPSGKGRLFMDAIGTGTAKIFLNGTVVDGTWKKASRTERTLFYDAAGSEVKFNRGKVWVEIVPPESVNTY